MNTPLTFELAIRESLAQFAVESLPVSWLHCAFAPADQDNPSGVESYPQMHVAAGGKALSDNGSTWETAVTVTCLTLSEMDVDGSSLAEMYGTVESMFEHLIGTDEDDDPVRKGFNAAVRRSIPGFCLGGFVPDASDGATVVDGVRRAVFSGVLRYVY